MPRLDQILAPAADQRACADSNSDLIVREISRDEVTAELISHWRDLESRSCHVNAFLSPEFLVPAWKWLESTGNSFLMTVEERRSGQLRALGCFQSAPGSRLLPLPHLIAARTIHSFRTGLLLDQATADATLGAWLRHLQRQTKWGGVVFPSLRLDSILAQRLQAAAKSCRLSWHPTNTVDSAAYFPPIAADDSQYAHMSAHRRKLLRKKERSLESLGPLRLRCIERQEDIVPALERFLSLEHAGWKGEQGTSLKSNLATAEFLRMMASGFYQRGRLVLTELIAGNELIANSINLLHGSTLFAFKIGWNPQFAKSSPGTLHHAMLLPLVYREMPGVTCVDSCSRPGSFLESLWPHRVSIADAVIPTSRLSQGTVAAAEYVRCLKKGLRGLEG